jgi:hypothetical protein
LDSTEPANYRGSYTTILKEIEDTEIMICSDGVPIMTGITTTAPVGATAKTTMELLLSMRVSEEGGLIK